MTFSVHGPVAVYAGDNRAVLKVLDALTGGDLFGAVA